MNRRELLIAGTAGVAASQLRATALAAHPIAAPKSGPIRVAFVVGRGANVMDIAGAWEVFQDVMIPSRGTTPDDQMPFRLGLISDSRAPFEATGGLTMVPHFSFDDEVPQPNVIVMGAQGEHTPKKILWIREKSKNADVTMSVCTAHTGG
jgi:transcriptional regulator GlxA family with amidase domain